MLTKLNEYLGHTQQIIYKVANELGYNLVKKIGAGQYGTAYLTNDNKIFKVSYSKTEANAADKLIGINCEYLCNYYNVYETNEFWIIVMEKLDTENVNKEKLKNSIGSAFDIVHLTSPNIKDVYRLFFNSYVRDFIKIYKEAKKYKVHIDTQNTGNFGLKNGHLAAFDLEGGFGDFKNLKGIEKLEKLYDEITKNREFSGLGGGR